MNVYNRGTLVDFYEIHPDCRNTLEKWYHDVLAKKWKAPNDIVKDFNKARTIKNNRVIFEINGNEYRLIAEVNYEKGWLFIKFIDTHAEYNRIDATTVDLYKRK